MRYIPIGNLKEGMVLGTPFYGTKFEVLLAQGMTLNPQHVTRINDLGYAGVYVLDSMSKDVQPNSLLPDEVRTGTIKAAKQFMDEADQSARQTASGLKGGRAKVTKERQERVINPVIDALIENERRVVDMIDLKPYDYYNYYHAAACVVLSLLIGLDLGVSGTQLYELGMAALLHDVGSSFIPRPILEKPGKLTPKEYEIIKSHAEKGFFYLRENYDISIEACIGALHHHENYNGSGYPNGLAGEKVSIYGRIVAVSDAYDALVSRRPYRPAMYPPQAMEIMRKRSGIMYDPDIVASLRRVVSLYPAGVGVELDTGVQCIVVRNYPGAPDRPLLRLLNSTFSAPLYMDLYKDRSHADSYIQRIIEIPS